MYSYTPKYEMAKGFTLGGQLVDHKRYDQLVDKFPTTFGPMVKYFQALKKEKEENERLMFLLKVSLKTSSSSTLSTFAETQAPLLTPIT